MKRILTILLTTILLTSCSLFYANEIDESYYHYVSGGIHNDAYLYQIDYDGSTSSFSIPDYIYTYKVTSLGGYYGRGYPMPFNIEYTDYIKETYGFSDEEIEYFNSNVIKVGCNVIYIDIFITFNKYLNDIYMYQHHIYVKHNDEEYIFLDRYNFEVPKENKHYYSSEGKLYTKDNELVDSFIYY